MITKATALSVCNEIKYDIDKGIYKQYPKLQQTLNYIARDLFEYSYLLNASALRGTQIAVLKENGYL